MMKEKNPRTRSVLPKAFMCYTHEKHAKKELYPNGKLYSTEGERRTGYHSTHIVVMCGSANITEDCKISLCDISFQDLFDSIVEGGGLHCDVFGALSSKIRHRSFMMRQGAHRIKSITCPTNPTR